MDYESEIKSFNNFLSLAHINQLATRQYDTIYKPSPLLYSSTN